MIFSLLFGGECLVLGVAVEGVEKNRFRYYWAVTFIRIEH
jgi:hypothetical protein